MKKLVSMALALSLCLAMFAGCGGTPSSSSTVSSGPSSSSEDTSTSGFENKELNIAIFEGGYGPEYWEEIVDRFEETYGVTVNMQISPTIGDIIRPQIVAGNVPDFISMNDNDTTGLISSMIRENALLDITDVFEGPGLEDTSPLKEQVLEGVLNTAKCSPYSDGKVYLAPFNASRIVYLCGHPSGLHGIFAVAGDCIRSRHRYYNRYQQLRRRLVLLSGSHGSSRQYPENRR